MFGGGENSGNHSTRNATNKDTLHITPHIAAHKSSGSQSSGESSIETSQEQTQSNSRLAAIQTFAGHVPSYRVGIPTSTIFTEPFQHTIRNQAAHIQVPTLFTLPSSKVLPQDLSSHSKLTIHEADNSSHQKSLPHIQTVGGQNLENIAAPLIVPVSDRSPTYYRLADGTTISISSQHQTVLVSSQNEDQSNIHHGHLESVRQNQHGESSISTTAVSASMPIATLAGNITSHQHTSVSGLPEGHLYIVPHDIPNGSGGYLTTSETILPDREMRTSLIENVKEEENGEHKDLVRQALQAAVVHNSHKNNGNQDVMDYNYGTDDIGGSDCLVHEDIICHSTFCSQPNVKPQELLLMNINVNHGQQTSGKVSGSNMNDNSNGGHVVMLDPASAVDESGNLLPPIILSSRRRRTRLSEEAQAIRREKIANRMREKRASETEEQKEKRRLREAERMRKKRAQEDDISKERRRREAAERARLRRAKLSIEERELERKKAAARMRLRRQNENEEQKRLRRIKAAERMRKRRSTETPEERAARKLNIALRMKVKRQKREDKDEKIDMNSSSLDTIMPSSEDDKNIIQRERNDKNSLNVSDTNEHYTTTTTTNSATAGHLVVTSSITGVPGNLTLIPNEHTNSQLLQGAILSAVDLAHIAQPMSLQVRNTSPPVMQRSPNSPSERSPISFHKSLVATQEGITTHSQESQAESRVSESPSDLTKTTAAHISSHHHIPHLLHHLTPHQDQHHHHHHHHQSHYIIPHQVQHSQSQNQPLQLRHQ